MTAYDVRITLTFINESAALKYFQFDGSLTHRYRPDCYEGLPVAKFKLAGIIAVLA